MNKEEKFPLLFPIEKLGKISRYGTVFIIDLRIFNKPKLNNTSFVFLSCIFYTYVRTSFLQYYTVMYDKFRNCGIGKGRTKNGGKEKINFMFIHSNTYVRIFLDIFTRNICYTFCTYAYFYRYV